MLRWAIAASLLSTSVVAETLAFHGFRTLGVEAEELSAMTAAAEEVLRSKAQSVEVELTRSAQCQADLACYCRAAREVGAEQAVYGNLGRMGRIVSLELVRVDVQSCQLASSIFLTEELDRPRARLAASLERLLLPPGSISETAMKDERRVERVPAILTVYSRRQLQELGITRLSELLAIIPGFEVVDTAWGDLLLHHGLQRTTLFLIDGIPLSNPMNALRYLQLDLWLQLENVDRVEIIRQPSSTLWGPNALLGMVNVVTRRPTLQRVSAEVMARGGTLQSYLLAGTVESSRPELGFALSGNWARELGPVTYVQDGPISLSGIPGGRPPVWGANGATPLLPDEYHEVFARIRVGSRLELLFGDIAHVTRHTLSLTGSLLPADSPGAYRKGHRVYGAFWRDQLPAGLSYRLSASQYESRSWEIAAYDPPHPDGFPEGQRYLQGHKAEARITRQLEAQLTHEAGEGFVKHRALLGAAYLGESFPDSLATRAGLYQEPPVETVSFLGAQQQGFAGYLHEGLTLGDALLVSAGARYEFRAGFYSSLSKEAAFTWFGGPLSAKVAYAEGFRPPSAVHLFSTSGTKGNPTLHPENSSAVTAEVAAPLGPVGLRLEGAYIQISNLIYLDSSNTPPGFLNVYANGGTLQVWSATAEARLLAGRRLEAFAAYTWKRALDANTPAVSTALAPHTGSAGLVVRPVQNVSGFVVGSLIGDRPVPVAIRKEQVSDRGVENRIVPTSVRLSVGLTASHLVRGVHLSLKVDNPLSLVRHSPYRLDGRVAPYVERRVGTEALLTLRYTY